MRKIISIIVCVCLFVGLMSGCTNNSAPVDNKKLNIVTTIFPEYDWVKEILGERIEHTNLTLLLDSGVDLHSYQPTANDMIQISTCDLFVYVGGESDAWVEDALKEATNKDMVVINLMDELGGAVKEEEIVEGMQEEEHEHDHGDEAHDHEEAEYDEHVWLSLKNARVLCNVIAGKLAEMDPEHKDTYTANASAYLEKLSGLGERYQSTVDGAQKKALLFGDRFPFRYLADDYGLTYYAAFVGCSAETEASFETITFLSKKIDELGLSCVLTIEGANHNIAQTVISNTQSKDQTILSLDSMQSTTMKDVNNGTAYLSVMEQNLEVLKEALR